MAESSGSLVERMVGAALLSTETFQEVEHDETATGQAAAVVAMVAVAQALGSWSAGPVGMVTGAIAAVVGWAVWAGITYLIGTKVFDGRATWGEVMRAIGFAQAPGLLMVAGVLPLAWLLLWVVPFWMAVAAFVGLREALDISGWKTFFTIVIGGVAYGVLNAIF